MEKYIKELVEWAMDRWDDILLYTVMMIMIVAFVCSFNTAKSEAKEDKLKQIIQQQDSIIKLLRR